MLKVVMGPTLGIDFSAFEPNDDVLIMDEWIKAYEVQLASGDGDSDAGQSSPR
jgi:hypothetical protein